MNQTNLLNYKLNKKYMKLFHDSVRLTLLRITKLATPWVWKLYCGLLVILMWWQTNSWLQLPHLGICILLSFFISSQAKAVESRYLPHAVYILNFHQFFFIAINLFLHPKHLETENSKYKTIIDADMTRLFKENSILSSCFTPTFFFI